MTTETLDAVLARLSRVRRLQDGTYTALCPAHDDHRPSLSVSVGAEGRVLVHCHAGCATADVLRAVGLEVADLFPGRSPPRATTRSGGRLYESLEAAVVQVQKALDAHGLVRYVYRSASGRPLMATVRFQRGDGSKTFRPFHPVAGGWRVGDPPAPLPLYGLDRLAAGRAGADVYVVEGEKCADAAHRLGLVAVTSAHGAAAASRTDWSPLAGRRVIVLPDADEAGEAYARDVVRLVRGLEAAWPGRGAAAEVRVVRLPGLEPGGDLVDFIAAEQAAGADDAVLCDRLDVLASEAPAAPLDEAADGLVTVSLADVEPEQVTWLWNGRMPMGKLTLLAGDPGVGKSIVTLDLAARVSRGGPMPLETERTDPADVMLLSAEDSPADTIRPRLERAGADLARVVAVASVLAEPTGSAWFNLGRHLNHMEAVLRGRPAVRLLVIDPIDAYLGQADAHRSSDVRAVLAPLARLAASRRVAVIAVVHLNKCGDRPQAVYRTMGSLAFPAAARAVWLLAKDTTGGDRRLLVPVKMNLGPEPSGAAFRFRDGQVQWEAEPVRVGADQLLADHQNPGEGGERAEAIAWLKDRLADGPVEAAAAIAAARDAGIALRTLKRAKRDLAVASVRRDDRWVWLAAGGEGSEAARPSAEEPLLAPPS